LLSVTIAHGIVEQKVLLADSSKKDGSRVDKSAYKVVQPRDIAYNKMRAWQGAIGASALRGIVSPAYVVMRLRNPVDVPVYFHHLYRTPQFAKEAERWSYGITSDMWSLRPEHFKMIYAPLPPPSEQAAIVQFLEWANGLLERAIRSKRKVIALLNEQKQAVIHRAVTRGLNPSVPLKASGIPWLGDIPAHWQVRKVKSLVRTFGGLTPNKGVERYWNGQIPWVSPKDMKVPEIFDSRDHISSSALRETNITLVPAQSVLIVVRGMILARTFPTAVTRVPVTINQDMKALVPGQELSADYFSLLLTGIQRELLELVEIAGHGTCCLRTDSWSSFGLPIPPQDEQGVISRFLAGELANANNAVSRLEREIELLREYRTRLVADLVTGKLDVREAVGKLPAEAAGPVNKAEAEDEPAIEEDGGE
jgi:type I restriction enzyme S subunit